MFILQLSAMPKKGEKMKKRVLLILAATLVICLLAACNPVVETFTITFDAQNGTAPVEIKFDESFAMPQNPANGDKIFGGWYSDKDCTVSWQAPETLTENITVYAKWDEPEKSVYVHFDAQNGAAPVSVKFDDKFAMPTPTNGEMIFDGWYSDKDCTTPWQKPQTLEEDVTVYAKWKAPHVHDFGDSYFLFVQCADPECKVTGRAQSTDSVKKLFVYNFSQESLDNINNDFDVLDEKIANGQDYEAFEAAFVVVDDDITYLAEQYQYAYFFYYAFNSEQYETDYNFVSQFYNTCVSRYYGLYRAIYESPLKDEFYEGWTEEDVRQALILSDSYGDSQYVELNNKIDEVVDRYYDLSATSFTSAQMSALYAELVPLNNSLARLAGYDNYMEYAYASRYEREYTPADVAVMRDYVKQYIVPAYDRLGSALRGISISTNAETSIYNAISGASVFGDNSATKKAVPYLGNYLKEMASDEFNQTIDFFATTNDVFKDGNYYLGSKSGAFTYFISAQDTSMLYFGDTKNDTAFVYQDSFTYVHEFGHFYNNVYNGGLDISLDHCETQSQGNEMMYLAWLQQNLNSKYTSLRTYLECEQLYSRLSTIVMSTAVDEFEQAAYTDSYEGKSLEGKYSQTFGAILTKDYGTMKYNSSYWQYVVFDNAGYYISYAMSSLPCVELYVNAMADFAQAKQSYFKLFAFSDSDELVTTYEDGSKVVTANYQEILNYCGLQSPFQEQLYVVIADYVQENYGL